MNKKTHTAEPSAAGAAVPEKEEIPAHKRQYITRHGGSVVLDASATTVHADAVAQVTEQNTTEDSTHA